MAMTKKVLFLIFVLSFFGSSFIPGLSLKTAAAITTPTAKPCTPNTPSNTTPACTPLPACEYPPPPATTPPPGSPPASPTNSPCSQPPKATVSNLIVNQDGTKNYVGSPGRYTVHFSVNGDALASTGNPAYPARSEKINIQFSPNFSFSGNTRVISQYADQEITCNPPFSGNTITCSIGPTSVLIDMTRRREVEIFITNVNNPSTANTYKDAITVGTTIGGSAKANVNVVPAQKNSTSGVFNITKADIYPYKAAVGKYSSYEVSFTGEAIEDVDIYVNFPPQFSLESATGSSNVAELECRIYSSDGNLKCHSNDNIADGTRIILRIRHVQNPDTPGNYNINVKEQYDIGWQLFGPSGTVSSDVNLNLEIAPSASANTIEDTGGQQGGGAAQEFGETDAGGVSFWDLIPSNNCSWYDVICGLEWLVTAVPGFLLNLILLIIRMAIGAIVAALIGLASGLVYMAASLNFDDPQSAAKIGWEVSLGISNIAFIIAIITIAFATILRIKSYVMEKTLPRLLIVAVLINFSFFFAVTAINISTAVGSGLMSAAGRAAGIPLSINDLGALGNIYKTALSASKSDSLIPGQNLGALQFLADALKGLIGIIMQAIFGLVAFFTLIATAVMLVIRYVVLTLLLALLPLALVASVFPNLKKSWWDKWMETFTKYLIFYPAVMFFLAIGFITAQKTLASPSPNPFLNIINLLVISGIMIGGLIVAGKLGIAGAGAATAIGGWSARKLALNKGSQLLGRALRRRGGAGDTIVDTGAGRAPASRLAFGQPIVTRGVNAPGGELSFNRGPSLPLAPMLETSATPPPAGGDAWIPVNETSAARKRSLLDRLDPSHDLKSQLKELPGSEKAFPSLRDSASKGLLKYSLGGKSLGGILKDAIPKDLGVFKEVGSMEGAKTFDDKQKIILEKMNKKSEESLKIKEEKLKDDAEDLAESSESHKKAESLRDRIEAMEDKEALAMKARSDHSASTPPGGGDAMHQATAAKMQERVTEIQSKLTATKGKLATAEAENAANNISEESIKSSKADVKQQRSQITGLRKETRETNKKTVEDVTKQFGL